MPCKLVELGPGIPVAVQAVMKTVSTFKCRGFGLQEETEEAPEEEVEEKPKITVGANVSLIELMRWQNERVCAVSCKR